MGDEESRPADRTTLAWQRNFLLLAGTAAVVFKTAVDDDQLALGIVGALMMLGGAGALYLRQGAFRGGPAPAAHRVGTARALTAVTLTAAAVSLLVVLLTFLM